MAGIDQQGARPEAAGAEQVGAVRPLSAPPDHSRSRGVTWGW
ncbi:hypothetical protein [uncultured Tateyamaria sp.]|nr:hypothetical protein [uncultured Tateyamaria sp.]